jgi:hypothetical protein
MCKHQQPKISAKTVPTTAAGAKSEESIGFVSCGLDRLCPTSVTKAQGQDIQLDQYQSSIREISSRRQKRNMSVCGEPVIESTESDSTFFDLLATTDDFMMTDHEFEWYDLDAIRELDLGHTNEDCVITISHDYHAGLIFTTERQFLSKGAEVNVVNPSFGKRDNKSEQEFEFDIFFWVNGDQSQNGETPDEREFRERMEELELEIRSEPPSLSSSDRNEAKIEDDHDTDGGFFPSWLFEDAKAHLLDSVEQIM